MAKECKINIEVALEKFTASAQFRRHLKSGQYLYVENRICLNRPKYIQWNAAVASLTDYAREHQDECCLSPEDFTSKTRTTYVVYRLQPKARHYRRHLPRREMPSHRFTENYSSIAALIHSLPHNFTEMLDKLIESSNMTEEDLAESSRLSEKTIQRLRNHEPKSVTLETVLQLCIGLHLHPILSEYLLRAADKHFMDTKLHTMYKFLLYTCYEYSVEACNDLLKIQGFPILGKTKK